MHWQVCKGDSDSGRKVLALSPMALDRWGFENLIPRLHKTANGKARSELGEIGEDLDQSEIERLNRQLATAHDKIKTLKKKIATIDV